MQRDKWADHTYKIQLSFGTRNLYESSLQFLWLLRARQHQVSAGVVHAQVIDVQASLKHGTQALHPADKRNNNITGNYFQKNTYKWKYNGIT